jgi:uncharacterized membrane protein
MANDNTLSAMGAREAPPAINTIGPDDLKAALAKGIKDFKAKPSHIFLLVIIYPVVGLFAARMAFGLEWLALIFPLMSGFALIGPLAAIGLYELSRRRENGDDISWRHAAGIIRSPSFAEIIKLSILLLVFYILWLLVAMAIYWIIFGTSIPVSTSHFVSQVFTTSAGWALIVVGTGIGFGFAIVVLAISAVSFPMLLDRQVNAGIAVQTSIAAFQANPRTMLTWGFIVAAGLVLGSIPLFIGLAVVMPVLGHATWHLYRAVVPR